MEAVLVFVILMWVPSIIVFILGAVETIKESKFERKLKRMMGEK